ncbi:MAG: hypothetical protein AB8B85_01335 [Paracoccaceae bacterium]
MAGKDKVVMRSIEAPGGQLCVDLFRRTNGRWGWAEYRRDPEDGRGWQDTGSVGRDGFSDEETALLDACSNVAWLRQVL